MWSEFNASNTGVVVSGCEVTSWLTSSWPVYATEGIESVEILQVSNVVSLTTELGQNAVDLTISCQGR